MGWTSGELRFDSRQGRLLFSQRSDPLWGPSSLVSNWYWERDLSLGVKRSGQEGDQSPPSSAEVRNGLYIKHKETLPFYIPAFLCDEPFVRKS
jgi:hypothetical protein